VVLGPLHGFEGVKVTGDRGTLELTVRRWKRYGKDRLYVNLPDGGKVGWLDLVTGDVNLDREDLRHEFDAAIAAHQGDGSAARTPSHSPKPPTPPTPPPDSETHLPGRARPRPEPDPVEITPAPRNEQPLQRDATEEWVDLAGNRAGQAARARALAERQAAPVMTFLARFLRFHTDERAWRIGADGEEMVASRLAKLPEGWRVLHALPVGERDADIDHLVIGPGGVFTVNTKHHPHANVWVAGNTFMVNGQRLPYIRNARHEARRAARLLSKASKQPVEVSGVIAVVGAQRGFTIKEQPENVQVLGRKRLAQWLRYQPAILSDAQVEGIHAVARRSDTWQ